MVTTRKQHYPRLAPQTSPVNTLSLQDEVAGLSSAASMQEEDTGAVVYDGDGTLAEPWQVALSNTLRSHHPPRLSAGELYFARRRMSLSSSPEADRISSGLPFGEPEGEAGYQALPGELGSASSRPAEFEDISLFRLRPARWTASIEPDDSDRDDPVVPGGFGELERSPEQLLPDKVLPTSVAPLQAVLTTPVAPAVDNSMDEVGEMILPGHLSVAPSLDGMDEGIDMVEQQSILMEITR
ncbi:hypothetical protein PM082_014591 [Marasmius tenuissimus]|nr:hypothetical protein PM082_014591 [Marasmius tenuissimus]